MRDAITVNRRWLARIIRHFPQHISYVEQVRVGQDVSTFVRITIFGVNCGIWRWE